jgi:hypothetical protein
MKPLGTFGAFVRQKQQLAAHLGTRHKNWGHVHSGKNEHTPLLLLMLIRKKKGVVTWWTVSADLTPLDPLHNAKATSKTCLVNQDETSCTFVCSHHWAYIVWHLKWKVWDVNAVRWKVMRMIRTWFPVMKIFQSLIQYEGHMSSKSCAPWPGEDATELELAAVACLCLFRHLHTSCPLGCLLRVLSLDNEESHRLCCLRSCKNNYQDHASISGDTR